MDDCSPCSSSALPQHLPSPLTGTVYPRYSRLTLLFTQVFALKVTLEELFYTVVLTYPLHHYYLPCICMCVGCVCVCVCVCGCGCVQTPLKSLDGKSTLVTILMSLAHETLLACVNNWETFVNKLIFMSTLSWIESTYWFY